VRRSTALERTHRNRGGNYQRIPSECHGLTIEHS
jgi:hypothetical protein